MTKEYKKFTLAYICKQLKDYDEQTKTNSRGTGGKPKGISTKEQGKNSPKE